MVASFHSCGTSLVIYTATMMPWNANKISWELSESPSLSSSAGGSSGPIALPLVIDLRAVFVLFTTGGSPSDRAVCFCGRLSIIVHLRAAEVVLSKQVKYRLHLARISSSFHRSFPSSSLIYCVLPNFLSCNFHAPLRYPYQPLMSTAKMNSSSSQAYTSRYLLQVPVLCSLHDLPEFSACLPQRVENRAAGQGAVHRLPSLFPLRPSFFKFGVHCLILQQPRYTGLSDLAWH